MHPVDHHEMQRADEALRRRDLREMIGPVARIAASLVFSRLWVPRGNGGRARVSAFKPMPVPADRHLVR